MRQAPHQVLQRLLALLFKGRELVIDLEAIGSIERAIATVEEMTKPRDCGIANHGRLTRLSGDLRRHRETPQRLYAGRESSVARHARTLHNA